MCLYLNFLRLFCSIWIDVEVSVARHIALGIGIHEVLSVHITWHLGLHHLIHNNHIVHILLLLFHLVDNTSQARNDDRQHNKSTGQYEEDAGIHSVFIGLVLTLGWCADEGLFELSWELLGWVESDKLDTLHAIGI